MRKTFKYFLAILLSVGFGAGSAFAAEDCPDDYPTSAKVDYVLACMASNGMTPDMLQRCSCSIDHIASTLSYKEYVEAETVLRTQRSAGERGIFFQHSTWAKEKTDKLAQAQALSTLDCF